MRLFVRFTILTVSVLALFCFAVPSASRADDGLPAIIQAQIKTPLAKVGQGRYRRFGFTIYRTTLWAPDGKWDATKPYALELRYARSLSKETLSDSIIDDIQDQNVADDETLARWSTKIKEIMPDVVDDDVMIGVANPGAETSLYFNGDQIAKIKDPALTQAFFNIWLGDDADEDLKNALLGQAE